MPTTKIKLTDAQITALRTHTTRHNGGLAGSLRTLRSLERHGLADVPQGFWNIFRINEAGLAELDRAAQR